MTGLLLSGGHWLRHQPRALDVLDWPPLGDGAGREADYNILKMITPSNRKCLMQSEVELGRFPLKSAHLLPTPPAWSEEPFVLRPHGYVDLLSLERVLADRASKKWAAVVGAVGTST